MSILCWGRHRCVCRRGMPGGEIKPYVSHSSGKPDAASVAWRVALLPPGHLTPFLAARCVEEERKPGLYCQSRGHESTSSRGERRSVCVGGFRHCVSRRLLAAREIPIKRLYLFTCRGAGGQVHVRLLFFESHVYDAVLCSFLFFSRHSTSSFPLILAFLPCHADIRPIRWPSSSPSPPSLWPPIWLDICIGCRAGC
jgi:hypothetical protein